ncbi:MAG TPA: hypothetical protein DCX18_02040, partial [Erysipelotrichaceae bacterium]|nr:hypothetical protein [Erysipelotrichaceae bacterium]
VNYNIPGRSSPYEPSFFFIISFQSLRKDANQNEMVQEERMQLIQRLSQALNQRKTFDNA